MFQSRKPPSPISERPASDQCPETTHNKNKDFAAAAYEPKNRTCRMQGTMLALRTLKEEKPEWGAWVCSGRGRNPYKKKIVDLRRPDHQVHEAGRATNLRARKFPRRSCHSTQITTQRRVGAYRQSRPAGRGVRR